MYKRSNEEKDVSSKKVRNCDTAESNIQSAIVDGEDTSEIPSFPLGNLSTSWCSLVCKPAAIKTANRYFLLQKVTQSWPSPALCFVETVPQDAQSSHVTAFNSGDGSSKSDNERDVHISMRLMEDFLDLAKENTEKDLETCGILGAYLEKGTLYLTTLIIPKQESASNSCQATNEEEVFKILNERSLYPVGWIHVCLPTYFAIDSVNVGWVRFGEKISIQTNLTCQLLGSKYHQIRDETQQLTACFDHIYVTSYWWSKTTILIRKTNVPLHTCEVAVGNILSIYLRVGWVRPRGLDSGLIGEAYPNRPSLCWEHVLGTGCDIKNSKLTIDLVLTHPSQSCFMSSVDLHTQYSYQVMIPEAFAIVLAPNDTSRSCGLFRLTKPEGMNILKNCQETGFHPHKEPDNGSPVYEHCSNVYKNSNLRFEIFDLRQK
ncbi:AMSH-like ubiquitin thioesterase 2 [Glycine max]|nr:AMSH-like ubiquitin thioesterase 2 [Glycine max]